MTHEAYFRVYYEDTDAGGVVYHANYLKFAERARTEMLRKFDINQSNLTLSHGVIFVVHKLTIDFKYPAKLDDVIKINTHITKITRTSIDLHQILFDKKNDKIFTEIKISLVCVTRVNNDLKPCRIPDYVVNELKQ